MDMLHPCAVDRMHPWPVGDRVGNTRNNDASLLDPVDSRDESAQGQLF
jgi:putative SOS response-associated peptidase YedK